MRAEDVAEPFPVIGLDTDVMTAARMMAERRLPGLIVTGDDGRPYTVLPGSQVLRFAIPRYVQDNPALALAFDEKSSDELWGKLSGVPVRQLLPRRQEVDELPLVDRDATTVEVAAVMARMHSPIVAVMDGNRMLGAITVSLLLQHLLPDSPPAP